MTLCEGDAMMPLGSTRSSPMKGLRIRVWRNPT